MVNRSISKKVISVGPDFNPPLGGIAQVLSYYNSDVFDEFNVIVNSCPGSKLRKLYCALSAFWLLFWKLLASSDLSIVHIHTASNVSFRRSVLFMKLAKLMRRQVIMHIHAGSFKTYYEANRDFVKSNLMKCDRILALSPVWKAFFTQEIGLKHVDVISNLVPFPTLECIKTDPQKKIEALFLGAIKEEKGIFDLLDVLAAHREQLQGHFLLHVCGDGEVDRFLRQVKDNRLEDIVTFEGWVIQEQKVRLLNQCNLQILPSYIEGVPICLLEAMSYGQSIISTRIGGIPSIVEDQVNGILIDPGDKEALWNAIEQHLSHRELLGKFATKSQQVVKNYYPDCVAQQLESVYKQLLAKQ